MIHHYITKYEESGEKFAEAWIQINLFGLNWCFFKKKIRL
ncbi:hypothetical protein A21D_00038 [Virgibacillus dokdonensis]|uniref:Uncharacterized protein n=1 Tax=Virgibacillus dokdonensis TaxID=302167 RepID=A0A2K9IUW0_9BACI|nr:hypothetical protein A21D_00038 [Virgibacillus dokdonensis]